MYRARLGALFRNTDTRVIVAFWLFGEFSLAHPAHADLVHPFPRPRGTTANHASRVPPAMS